MRAAYGEGLPDYELIIGSLCERFHKLPEQVEAGDLGRLLRMVDKMELYDIFRRLRAGEKLTPAEHATAGEILGWDMDEQKKAT